MRWKSLLTIPVLIILAGCGDFGQSLTEAIPDQPLDRFNSFEDEDICHRNMLDLQAAEHIYYSTIAHEYTDDLDALYEILGVDSLVCPSCGSEYSISAGDEWFRIECPLGVRPNHGYVTQFLQSWPPDPEEYCDYCRENMLILRNALIMYYSRYGEGYPPELSDLYAEYPPAGDLECPACGEVYFYQVGPEAETYFLSCPLDRYPNHGQVNTGTYSW